MNKEERHLKIVELAKTMTIKEIAEELNELYTTIYNYCNTHGIHCHSDKKGPKARNGKNKTSAYYDHEKCPNKNKCACYLVYSRDAIIRRQTQAKNAIFKEIEEEG